MKMYPKKSGFTLVEILVASTIGTFISLIAIGTLHSIITGSDMVERNINAATEIRFASNILTRDLANFYNAENFEDTEFEASVDAYTEFEASYLVFYSVNRAKARIYEPECDIYEVEYYLDMEDDDSLSLKRRVWPNPNDEFTPAGILTTIAENIEYFDVSYFDSTEQEWYTEWPEDMEYPPDLVEFTIMTRPLGLGNYISETHLVNLVRQVNETEATVQ